MEYILIGYFMGIIIVIFFVNRISFIAQPIYGLKLSKNGLKFYSKKRHRIYVGECRIMQIKDRIYIKRDKKIIILNNVDRVIYKKGYVYFRALGKVNIIFDARAFYKYFNIDIKSPMFDLSEIKNEALISITKNLFNTQTKEVTRYLNLIINILKIQITDKSIAVKQNKYNLKFQIRYVARDKLKTINIT